MTALPPIADITDADTTEGEAKTWLSSVRSFLAGLLGTTGTVADALAALGLSSVVKTINSTSPDSAGNFVLDTSNKVSTDAGVQGIGLVLMCRLKGVSLGGSINTLASGATCSYSDLYLMRVIYDEVTTHYVMAMDVSPTAGTWRNVSGFDLSLSGTYQVGYLQRIA